MATEHNLDDIKLTSSEMVQLWGDFMSDSMASCVLSYFANKVEDPDVAQVIDYALDLSNKHLKMLTDIFRNTGFPIPVGFSDSDVNTKAKRLYSDSFMLLYLRNFAKYGMMTFSMAVAMAARSDIREFFTGCAGSSAELINKCDDLLLKKGLFIRAPYIQIPDKVEFTHKQSILGSLFGDNRPLNAMEIAHLHGNIETNITGAALLTGFSQVAESSRVKKFMVRGKELALKQVEVFGELLKQDDIPVPGTWDNEVLDSTDPPFSDKLIMFHVSALNAFGASSIGISMSASMRKDVGLAYSRILGEVALYGKDGADIMLDNEWFEKMPEAVKRDKLVHA